MKILSNKRYNDLLEKISLQAIEIEELEETNKVARSKYYEQLNECDNKEKRLQRLYNDLEDAKYYNQCLQERLNASQKRVNDLLHEKSSLEAEIERAKEGVQS